VSDATPPVVDTQLTYDIGKQDFEVIDATLPFEQVVASCLDKIGSAGKARP
jgi:hypothetical protein